MANVTLTINPIPTDATVTLTAVGYFQTGNSITVPEGTQVSYIVSKTDYATTSGVYTPSTSVTLSIPLSRPQIDINLVMDNLSELLTNSVELTDKFYDLFFNPAPLDVTFKHYNNENKLVEVTVPNRAKTGAPAFHGEGSPEGIITAAIGAIYIDETNRQAYVKAYASLNDNEKNGWRKIPTENQIKTIAGESIFGTGNIDPFPSQTGKSGKFLRTSNNTLSWEDVITPSDVINNLTSTTTNKPLSASMGKELQDEIDNLKARGRYLSVWNCTTGLPETNPTTSPYAYKTGDYYIVGTVAASGGTNYKPNGTQYVTGEASTTVETNTVLPNDTYIYDGTNWILQANVKRAITFEEITGQPTDNTNLVTALNNKVTKNEDITAGTHTKITYDSKGLVTAGTDLSANDIPSLNLTKITDVTATATEVNVLDGITASTAELNYCDGVTRSIQTQLNEKLDSINLMEYTAQEVEDLWGTL